MKQTRAEQLADKLNSCIKDPSTLSSENFYLFAAQDELRRLSPMEMELAGTKAASIARQADLMGKNEALKARVKELEIALLGVVGQVEQARDGMGIYSDSPSMTYALDLANNALAQTVGEKK